MSLFLKAAFQLQASNLTRCYYKHFQTAANIPAHLADEPAVHAEGEGAAGRGNEDRVVGEIQELQKLC